ncbi:MAG: DUF1232 domain-containing protein [Paludibacteraceae bacterium]|nr:DUF1232 domain-containing protein [Paludibacteraceae bacterium]
MSSFTILCLLILADVMLGRPVGHLFGKVANVNWSEKFSSLLGKDCSNLKEYAIRVGRIAAKPFVTFFYVVRDEQTTTLEKVLIFAAIAYVLSPSLVSKRVFRFLGVLDDSIAVAYVFNKIADKVTPEILTKVDATLNAWFGIETVEVLPA